MTDLFADERLQFFLRNRDDIKAWADIETDVMAATRELLARAQPAIEERILSVDPVATVQRHDNGGWERILARHQEWPASVGLTLEWNRKVDPAAGERPKIGVFWSADVPTLIAPRVKFTELVDKARLQGMGFKVPWGGVWPVGNFVAPAHSWWQEPDSWIASIVEKLGESWPLVAPSIDEAIARMSPA